MFVELMNESVDECRMGEGAEERETETDKKYEQQRGGRSEHDVSGACEEREPRGSCWQTVENERRQIYWD